MPGKELTLDELMELVDDAWCRQCLLHIAASSPEITTTIVKCLKTRVHLIDRTVIADELYNDLNCLDVEELWAHSGRTREGYVDVYEKASEMFQEIVEPGIEEMKRLQDISLYHEANEYCMGIMKGIANFSTGNSEFLDWITGDPKDAIKETFITWKNGNKSRSREQAEVKSLYHALMN